MTSLSWGLFDSSTTKSSFQLSAGAHSAIHHQIEIQNRFRFRYVRYFYVLILPFYYEKPDIIEIGKTTAMVLKIVVDGTGAGNASEYLVARSSMGTD